ncbi:Alpha/Beta hydrolase fold [Rhypophila sp. PSN 637]
MHPTVCQIIFLLGFGLHSLANYLPVRSSDSDDQRPITASDNNAISIREPLFPYTRKELGSNSIACNAGSRQYTGEVNLSDEKRLFYWFIESRNDPKNSPTMVYLPGGPGGSALEAVFLAIGPCSLNEHSNATVYENTTWTEFTNLLFIDQPVGVGFSATPGAVWGFVDGIPNNLDEVTQDLYNFLLGFYNDVLPQYASNHLHFLGSSFGGIFAPAVVDYINSRRGHPNNTIPEIASVILESGWVDGFTAYQLALFEHNCNPAAPRKFPLLNDTICDELEIYAPQCERSAAICREKHDIKTCIQTASVCNRLSNYVHAELGLDGMQLYDDRYTERTRPPVMKPMPEGKIEIFLKNESIREELGVTYQGRYDGFNPEVHSEWVKHGGVFVPSTHHMERILNKTDTRVLVLNGNNDGLVTTEGQKRVFDSLVWRRQASYRMHQFVDWKYPLRLYAYARGNKDADYQDFLVKGGQWKKTDDGPIKNKLAFFTVDEAGHASTYDQREAITWLVGCWMGMRKEDKRCPV